MKNKLKKSLLQKFCGLLCSFFVCTTFLSACAGSEGGTNETAKKDGKKKAPKRCKMKSCHVRMVHMHEGKEMKGKRGWFLKACFYFGNNPKYGEGLKQDRRDPYQGRRR
jgi:hypothetical protein